MADLVKIRILNRGPNKNHCRGEIVLVDRERAALLVALKAAEYVAPTDEEVS